MIRPFRCWWSEFVKSKLIDRFFREFDREWRRPAEIILTGAAAGALLGNVRPSFDVDFEIRISGKGGRKPLLVEVLQRVSKKTGMAVNYSEDISHWSMINYLDYRRTALPYKKIGRLTVKIMSPEYWTIGKMARYLESDAQDVLKIIKKKRLESKPLLRLWAKALASSILSLASGQFRDHVVHFLRSYGRSLWGKNFDSVKAIALFNQATKIK